MKWIDVQDIAIELADNNPALDPLSLRFTELMQMVMDLPEFSDDKDKCNEKILEAIQMTWLDERD